MMPHNEPNDIHPRTIFPDWYDERAEYETPAKGWLNDVIVATPDGSKYPVSFIDPVRLQQDMEEYVRQGTAFFSEPGLIILDEVSTTTIQTAVNELWLQGFFNHLRPLSEKAASALAAEKRSVHESH